mmetsp:Transcript_76383/g.204294  ORF Transcript_76383/g.204294 Transcript_76383/m.204294 type:complete len:273 (-) Transcript_76383:210-1028(-)
MPRENRAFLFANSLVAAKGVAWGAGQAARGALGAVGSPVVRRVALARLKYTALAGALAAAGPLLAFVVLGLAATALQAVGLQVPAPEFYSVVQSACVVCSGVTLCLMQGFDWSQAFYGMLRLSEGGRALAEELEDTPQASFFEATKRTVLQTWKRLRQVVVIQACYACPPLGIIALPWLTYTVAPRSIATPAAIFALCGAVLSPKVRWAGAPACRLVQLAVSARSPAAAVEGIALVAFLLPATQGAAAGVLTVWGAAEAAASTGLEGSRCRA